MVTLTHDGDIKYNLWVTGHWSEWSLVRKVTGPNSNTIPKVVFDHRSKETLNSFSYVHAVRPFRNLD